MASNPWRYACPGCWSVQLTPRTRLGGYRCQACGHIMPTAADRADRTTAQEGVA